MKHFAINTINHFSFYKIKHRIPGRVRLYIPALEKLPPDWYSLAEIVRELITLKKGIHSAKIEPISGGVVLHYRSDLICEKEVLKWLELMVERFIDLIRCSKQVTKEECISSLHLLRSSL
jgi:hypothetical protein